MILYPVPEPDDSDQDDTHIRFGLPEDSVATFRPLGDAEWKHLRNCDLCLIWFADLVRLRRELEDLRENRGTL